MNDKNKIVDSIYYLDETKYGVNNFDENKSYKKRRPHYVLCGIDNENYFLVKLTTQDGHKNKRKRDQTIKYLDIELKGKKTNIMLEKNKGWREIKKIEIQNDKKNVSKSFSIKKENKEKLKSFYSSTIKEWKLNKKNN